MRRTGQCSRREPWFLAISWTTDCVHIFRCEEGQLVLLGHVILDQQHFQYERTLAIIFCRPCTLQQLGLGCGKVNHPKSCSNWFQSIRDHAFNWRDKIPGQRQEPHSEVGIVNSRSHLWAGKGRDQEQSPASDVDPFSQKHSFPMISQSNFL